MVRTNKNARGANATAYVIGAAALWASITAAAARVLVILPQDASLSERTAARELSTYMKQVTRTEYSVRRETDSRDVTARIYIGPTQFAREHGVDIKKMGGEEWIIRSVGTALVLAGGRPRGTLYAVYRFLEDDVGVHWWNPWEETVPHRRDIPLDGHDRRGKPVFPYRDIYMTYGNDGGRFAARNRLNRNGDRRIAPEYGGCRDYGPPYHVHTFYRYVPPSRYFKSHPEYFSLINGKRTIDRAQLCLTNPAVRTLVVQQLKDYIEQARKDAAERDAPPPNVFDISQNDWGGACQCANCQRITDAEGSEAGVLLDFLNHVSDAIREEYPDIYIDTLAYQYTQKPPKRIRPRDNIIIRLCDTGSNFTRPITDPQNEPFRKTLLAWARIAKNLRVWDYAVTYAEPRGLPFPSTQTYAPDYRFYAEHHVEGVFTELEFPVIADMRDLKVWMMMKLLEDPYRDPEHLLDAFTTGFYGPAGPTVRQYLRLLQQACADKGGYVSMGTSFSGMGYLDWAFIRRARELFDRAAAAVHGDAVLERRVRHARLALDRATLVGFKRWTQAWKREGRPPGDMPLDRDNLIRRIRRTWTEQIALRIPHSGRTAATKKMEDELVKFATLPVFVPLPVKFRDQPPGTVFDFTADMFRNWRDIVRVVKDPDAESGITARLDFPPPVDATKHTLKKYRLPMPWGLYRPSTKKFLFSRTIQPEDVPGPGYHWYKLGSFSVAPTTYLYFFWSWIIQLDLDSVIDPKAPDAKFAIWARIRFQGPEFPHGNPGEKNAICVERVVLIRE
ncbi:MAG: DUF4838 domain-containing protein [Kiritimatiellaeota bacterium]|nr:DUF4838 domain-containing protein [Kiritimatiellota bacterium]